MTKLEPTAAGTRRRRGKYREYEHSSAWGSVRLVAAKGGVGVEAPIGAVSGVDKVRLVEAI